jgi:hypothetical protein
MSAREPAEASTLFERYFADSDLTGLMSLYEEDAAFPTSHGTSTGHHAEASGRRLSAHLEAATLMPCRFELVAVVERWVFTQTDGLALAVTTPPSRPTSSPA